MWVGNKTYHTFSYSIQNSSTLNKQMSVLFLGSTDFGNVTHVVPGLHPYFYIGSDALNHTEQYTEAAGE